MVPEHLINEGNIKLPSGIIAALENTHQPNQIPILAIHGWLDNAASFIPLMNELPEYNWTAIDLPGHGNSYHRPPHTHYHFIDWVSDLINIIDVKYGNKPVVIVGHSLGGMLATVLAGVYPELVKKLVVIDAVGLVTQSEGATEIRKALDSRIAQSKKQKTKHISLNVAIKARANAGKIKSTSAELLVRRNIDETEGGFEWKTDKRLRTSSPVRLSEQQSISIIQHIASPVMLFVAKDGYEMVKSGYKKYKSYYPNLIKKDVIGAHHCHMDEPIGIALEIKRFIG
ncbi:MAG: pimeloyl-ACP methyl ester carboxylesterase [Psychrosphaera sp.]